jgi:hypothetical protein
MRKAIHLALLSLVCGLIFAGPIFADDAGIGSGSGSGSSVEPAPLPDPLEQPGESIGLLTKLYKGGQIAALSVLVAFFALTIASRKIKWLQEGYRKVIVSSALGAIALLAVPASEGTTPNLSMIIAAVVAAVTLAIKPKADA